MQITKQHMTGLIVGLGVGTLYGHFATVVYPAGFARFDQGIPHTVPALTAGITAFVDNADHAVHKLPSGEPSEPLRPGRIVYVDPKKDILQATAFDNGKIVEIHYDPKKYTPAKGDFIQFTPGIDKTLAEITRHQTGEMQTTNAKDVSVTRSSSINDARR